MIQLPSPAFDARDPGRRKDGAPATLSDVARHAGVSAMTASRVINGNVTVTDEKRSLVEEAVRVLGYVPNKAARALSKSGSLRSLVFAFRPHEAGLLMAMVDSGLAEAAERLVDLTFLPVKKEQEIDLVVRRASEAGVAGMILAHPLCEQVELHSALRRAGIRVLAMGQAAAGVDCSSVRVDERLASFELTTHLLSTGHRQIGFVATGPRDERSALRHAGFVAAMVEAGASHQDHIFWTTGADTLGLLKAVEAATKMEPPLTAVVASDPRMTWLLMRRAAELRAEAGSALLVCGFEHDSLSECGSTWPSSVQLPSNEMARLAVRQLARELAASRRGHVVVTKQILVDHAVLARSGAPTAMPRHAAIPS